MKSITFSLNGSDFKVIIPGYGEYLIKAYPYSLEFKDDENGGFLDLRLKILDKEQIEAFKRSTNGKQLFD